MNIVPTRRSNATGGIAEKTAILRPSILTKTNYCHRMALFNTNAWNRIRYTVWAPIYNRLAKVFAPQRKRSFEVLNLQAGERVLLVGAATGVDLDFLPPGVHATAIDITPAMIGRLNQHAQELKRKLNIAAVGRVMDAQQMDFADGSFDAVVLHLILAVVPDPIRCLCEVERVLRTGGRAVIFDKFAPDTGPIPWKLRLLNPLASLVATHVNRKLETILRSSELVVEMDENAGMNGFFRIVLVRKPGCQTESAAIG